MAMRLPVRVAALLIAEEVPTLVRPAASIATTVTETWHTPIPIPINRRAEKKPTT